MTLNKGRGQHPKYSPHAFTEHGILMLSSVLNSERAIQVNIAIMRVFVNIRRIVSSNKEIVGRLDRLEDKVEKQGKSIKTIFEVIRKPQAVTKDRLLPRRGESQ
ncbi:hypothetical protein COS91_01910 [Candidatus Desantisbacteria bacterium CG07_land_8_20_14_0_80_39_15]|uniref:KilA-N DNA-binding domain-containing protein n=2 Tax=unclassified Candidatus Desantisiibacteriota TaxID=3106372 RepID=A0A2M6ZHR6_9BACT|nr:MAG: hypothetical protein COS91_01910 [Candidatus Desantisbacteria bacterium CG07_land_8_20_14_0_80_39_15]